VLLYFARKEVLKSEKVKTQNAVITVMTASQGIDRHDARLD